MLSARFLFIVFDLTPSRLPTHVCYVLPAYRVLALLIKCILPVKCIDFLLSAYFLATTSYKRMRLTTSFYGTL